MTLFVVLAVVVFVTASCAEDRTEVIEARFYIDTRAAAEAIADAAEAEGLDAEVKYRDRARWVVRVTGDTDEVDEFAEEMKRESELP